VLNKSRRYWVVYTTWRRSHPFGFQQKSLNLWTLPSPPLKKIQTLLPFGERTGCKDKQCRDESLSQTMLHRVLKWRLNVFLAQLWSHQRYQAGIAPICPYPPHLEKQFCISCSKPHPHRTIRCFGGHRGSMQHLCFGLRKRQSGGIAKLKIQWIWASPYLVPRWIK
jgi:hypothetical protein